MIDSPWGISYNITRRQVITTGERICLSVTATNISCAEGKYQRPLIDCNQCQIRDELLVQLFGDTEMINSPDYQGFHPGPEQN